jgi:transcriptional regulatory protein LevR
MINAAIVNAIDPQYIQLNKRGIADEMLVVCLTTGIGVAEQIVKCLETVLNGGKQMHTGSDPARAEKRRLL